MTLTEERAVVGVARKSFVAAFSGNQDLYKVLGELGDIVQGDCRRLADWVLHVPNIFRQEFGELVGIDGGFVMLGAIFLRGQTSIGALVRRLGIGKADGVAADGMRCFGGCQ